MANGRECGAWGGGACGDESVVPHICVTTKPRDIRQLASECSQIMAGVYYVVTLAT